MPPRLAAESRQTVRSHVSFTIELQTLNTRETFRATCLSLHDVSHSDRESQNMLLLIWKHTRSRRQQFVYRRDRGQSQRPKSRISLLVRTRLLHYTGIHRGINKLIYLYIVTLE